MVYSANARITIPLSVVMVFFSVIILSKPPKEVTNVADKPVFTSFRDQHGEFFATHRLEQAFIHYYLLHAMPATIWSVLMPLQYWDSFRKQYPAVHRICGYAVALCATVLSFSGLAFIPWELSYSASTFTLHTIYGYPILPTFNAGGIAVAPVLLYTGVRAVYLARHKRFAEHRRWTVYHGITGYLISIQRVWMIVVNILGAILDKSVALQRFLGTDQLHGLKTISDSELSAMAFTTWAAIFTSLGWWYYLHQSNAIKKGKSIRLH